MSGNSQPLKNTEPAARHAPQSSGGEHHSNQGQPDLFFVNALTRNFTGVYVRVGPGLRAAIIASLNNGARLQVIGRPKSGGQGLQWVKVRYHHRTGYARADLLTPQRPQPLSPLYVDQVAQGFVGVYLWAQPSLTAPIEVVIPNGVSVQALTSSAIVADGERWYHAIYHDQAGYVRAKLLRRHRPSSIVTLFVDGFAQGYTGAYLRTRPSGQAAVETLVPDGATIRVTGVVGGDDGKNWSKVVYDGMSGFTHSSVLTQQPPQPFLTLYADARTGGYTGVNLRQKASMAAPIQIVIPNGVRIPALAMTVRNENGDEWYEVAYDGLVGYARGLFLQPQAPASSVELRIDGAAQGFTGVNLRPQPNMQAPVLALIPNETNVRVTEVVQGDDGKNWSRVMYQGMSGYAHSSILDR